MGTRPAVKNFEWLRVAATSAVTTLIGLVNAVSGRVVPSAGSLAVGNLAPDFELAASDGRTYRLADYRGRQVVVIAWFPKAFTGGCTIECKSLAANRDRLAGQGAKFFGASVDTAETNRRFADAIDAGFPILSDPGRSVARAYGVLGRSGFPSRRTFYIGLDGRILAVDDEVRVGSHGTDIEERLEKLQKRQQA